MLLASLASLALAAGLDGQPSEVTAAELLAEVDRLAEDGFTRVAVVVEGEELIPVLEEIAAERPKRFVDGAACVIRVGGSPDALQAWLTGSCVEPLILTLPALERIRRLSPYDFALPPHRVFEGANLPSPLDRRDSSLGNRGRAGLVTMLVGGGLAGASFGWHQAAKHTNGTSEAGWVAMVTLNTIGWAGVAGGGIAVVSTKF